jgi:subtilase family serine protease
MKPLRSSFDSAQKGLSMLARRFVRALLAVTAMLAGADWAFADEPIEHEGNVYHQAVCSRGIAHGQARCHAHLVVDENGRPVSPHRPDKGAPGATVSYSANALRTAYGITGSGSAVVAIVDAYGYPSALADLNVYRAANGLSALANCQSGQSTQCFLKVDQNGGTSYPAYNRGWAQEQALDLDMVSAACPGCTIVLVQATSSQYKDLAVAENLAASPSFGAVAISNSYGGGEGGTTAFAGAYDHPGVAVTVSSGDNGYGVQFPASAPTVVAVGGTTLTVSSGGSWAGETVWSGTGSGCSSLYAKPSWQSATNTAPNCAKRMETDVSAVADPNTGVSVYGPSPLGSGSTWLTFGGTSVGAPLIAGIYGVAGGWPGSSTSTPYAAQYLYDSGSTSLHDVTSGTNAKKSGLCSPSYYCTARVGYDGPTGYGTPYGLTAF